MTSITIRPLDPTEWALFRDFRLAALQAAPGMFSATYDEAAARTPDAWQSLIHGSDHQVFGLFDAQSLIGITAVFQAREDPTGTTAQLAMSFILPAYRGRHLSRLFYEARLAWIHQRPHFRRVLVSVRASNAPSRQANQRYGFVETHRAPQAWHDGGTDDEIFYELTLPAAGYP